MSDKLLDDSFTELLRSALKRFGDAADAATFLNTEIGEANASAIRETLVEIRRLAQEAASARSRGESNAHWLGERLDDPARESLSVALSVDGNDTVAVGRALLERTYGSFFATKEAAGVSAAVQEAAPALQEVSKSAEAFFNSPLGASEETEFSAVVGGVAYQYLTAQGVDVSPTVAAAAVDVALFTSKVGYQSAAGAGEAGSTGAAGSSVDDAVEAIGDRIAATLAAIVGQVVEAHAETAGRLVGRVVGQFFKMGPIAEEVGGKVGRWAGPVVRPFVEQGVRFVTRHVVNGASKAVQAASTWARAAASQGLKSLFG
jgi:hypothetical protein